MCNFYDETFKSTEKESTKPAILVKTTASEKISLSLTISKGNDCFDDQNVVLYAFGLTNSEVKVISQACSAAKSVGM